MSYRSIKTNQRLERKLAFTGTSVSTTALSIGSGLASVTDNGTGDTTITFTRAFARTPVCTGLNFGTSATIGYVSAISTTSVRIKSFAVDGTTAKDAIFSLEITGWDTASSFSENL